LGDTDKQKPVERIFYNRRLINKDDKGCSLTYNVLLPKLEGNKLAKMSEQKQD